ncbi:MAG TPA: S9 family peptidase [Pyrinomonadaceae bacterium]|nr:S9 family peptidase [Pyrinomonadaceae bacterium]
MKTLLMSAAVLVLVLSAGAQNYTIQQYLTIKSANSPTFSPDARQMAYLTNVTGTQQVWVIDLPIGKPRQLTNYDDNVGFVQWMPDGNGIIFGKAKGGDENTQFFWMRSDGSGVRALTDDPKVRHNFGTVSTDGKTIYYTSNKRDRNYFDIYRMDIASGKEERLFKQDGNNNVVTVNDNGSKLIFSRDGTELSLDNDLYLLDTRSGDATLLTRHSGASEFTNAHFVADGIVLAQNDGREFATLSQIRKKNAAGDDWSDANRELSILDNANWDVSEIEMEPYPSVLAYTINRDGFSELYLRKVETDGKPLITTVAPRAEQAHLPAQGIVGGMAFSKDQNKLAFGFSSATQNGDIWIYDLRTKRLTQVTHSDRAGIAQASFIAPALIKFKSFDRREIPAWFYRPRVVATLPNGKKRMSRVVNNVPVIVSVHGGPEGQERPGFNALYQYYLSRGYAILAPNVRGSTGYGKTYTHLDDVRNREDSVKDLAYAVNTLKSMNSIQANRFAVMGGSYGGYMTLAAITLYPDLWAAAVDTVGISNWESFLKNTSGYRRRKREVEYGRLDRDIDFLRSISPIAKIDRIKCPLFVIAGRNDPRVPWTEGQQMVDVLRKRGATVEWKVYEDEGHGVAKLKNRLELYPLVADFLDRYMK